jgi:hypothetical protein
MAWRLVCSIVAFSEIEWCSRSDRFVRCVVLAPWEIAKSNARKSEV